MIGLPCLLISIKITPVMQTKVNEYMMVLWHNLFHVVGYGEDDEDEE
jgi:hypothetical protein